MKNFLKLLILVVCLSCFAEASPTLVQIATAENLGTPSSLTATFGSNATVGNTIIAFVVNYNSATVSSVVDTNASGLGQAVQQNTQTLAAIYSEVVGLSGVNTITVNLTAASVGLIIAEYKGLAASSPLDVTSANDNGFSPGSTAVTSNSTTTLTTSGELAIGVISQWRSGSFTLAAGSGWTSRATTTSGNMMFMDQLPSTTTGLAATGTVTPSANSQTYVLIATFKPAASIVNMRVQGTTRIQGTVRVQ